jgi:hypothetical protein
MKIKNFLSMKIKKIYEIMKNLSSNEIGIDGAAKLGEGISKLQNLISLNQS